MSKVSEHIAPYSFPSKNPNPSLEEAYSNLNKKPDSNIGFEWSLKPLIVFLKVFTGIRLTGKGSKFVTILLVTYSLFLLLLNFWYTLSFMIYFSKYSKRIPFSDNYSVIEEVNKLINTEKTVSLNPNIYIEHFNKFIYLFGTHFCFFIFLQWRLKALWKSLENIEKQIQLPSAFYLRVRRNFYYGFFPFVLPYSTIDLVYATYTFFTKKSADSSVNISFLKFEMLALVKIFPLTIHFTFWILVRTASILFSVLKQQIKHVIKKDSSIELAKLKEWKVHHRLTCKLIKKINSCFGIVILILISRTFGQLIYNTYQIVSNLLFKNTGFSPSYFLYTLSQKTALPALILFSSCRLAREASDVGDILNYIDKNVQGNSEIQNVLNGFLLQAIQTKAKISAAGLFDMDLTLLPTLIGTTLTYLIILLQQS